MGKVIVIHANCRNSTARGDYVFAANLAKDLMGELESSQSDMKVILVSTLTGVKRFQAIYEAGMKTTISVDGIEISLSSLEELDAVENRVVAFIDAARCKFSSTELVQRVLSPESKFLFIGNVNQYAYSDLSLQTQFRKHICQEQAHLYESFNKKDLFMGSAGLGSDRLGLPMITKANDLAPLSKAEQALIPSENYGCMYLMNINGYAPFNMISQYMRLSEQPQYLLVGDFTHSRYQIEIAYLNDISFPTSNKRLPPIHYHQSLPNRIMRKLVANSSSQLVLSTGVISTLEAMQDKKLSYYQPLDCNKEFVASYLLAVQAIATTDSSLLGCVQLVIELSTLLFADKPLTRSQMRETHNLLQMNSVNSNLIEINQKILEQANGKIAPRLLSFINGSRSTQNQTQLATVCASLRKKGETGSPVHDEALRRASAWGRLFELKVLIVNMAVQDLNKADTNVGYTALHFAVRNKQLDCARELINSGASLDIPSVKNGKTPLHLAIQNGDRKMIKLLIKSGASLEALDDNQQAPKDCTIDQSLLMYINHCCSSAQSHI